MQPTIKTHPQTKAYRDGYDAIDWEDTLRGRYLSQVCLVCPHLVFDDNVQIVDGMIVGGEPLCGYTGPGKCADEEMVF